MQLTTPMSGRLNPALFFLQLATLLVFLTACQENKDETVASWDGQWERTIFVPKGIQGRCVDEKLNISRKKWFLRTVVHSTYECNQPFLELAFEGKINEIKIRKGSNDRDIRFQVSDIHLVELVDVAGNERSVLKGVAVEGLSSKYVPSEHTFFEQKANLSKNADKLEAIIFPPILDMFIPKYPDRNTMTAYKRVN